MATLTARHLHIRAATGERRIGSERVRQKWFLQPQCVAALKRGDALGRRGDVLGENLAGIDQNLAVLTHAGTRRFDMGFVLR
jgi:hypothetical protein